MKMRAILVTLLLLSTSFMGCGFAETADVSGDLFATLEPYAVFSYFQEISAIPRASGDTKAISDYVADFAKANGLEYHQDEMNNIIIWAPATAGYESSAPIALQAHLDMVCISKDNARDPAVVGVTPLTDGEWIFADGTSLGADNGIGMAILLSILTDKTAEHPPIEAVFTVDEETGLFGADAIDVSLLTSRRMVNLDSEAKNECTASSAAGRTVDSHLPVSFGETAGRTGFRIALSGLLGGHSGVMIHLGRANANVLMARLLAPTLEAFDVRIAQWKGGIADNVIASSAYAVVAVPEDEAERFTALLNETSEMLRGEYAQTDAGMTFAISPTEVAKAVSHEDTQHIVTMLCNIPDGLIKMSEFIKDMPSLSLNTGVSELRENDFFIKSFLRSNVSADIEPLYERFVDTVTASGCRYEVESSYGAWDFAEVSPIREQALQGYKNVLGVDATVVAVHGGLECGVFADRIPGMDIVALGPNLLDAHSTDEKVEVQSIADLYAVTLDILKGSK